MWSVVRVRFVNRVDRIGILGGTFDPIHCTHIAMARAALEEAKLDKILFVISARPPHKIKKSWVSAEDRFDMVKLALENENRMDPSRIEIDRTGPSYTIDTLKQLSDLYPGADLFLIMGFDSLLDLPNWKDPDKIMKMAKLLVVPRPDSDTTVPEEMKDRYLLLSFEENAVSSTDIRKRIADNESLDGLIPQVVEQFIRQRGIYRADIVG